MTGLRIGEMCAGYGGLGMAVQRVLGGEIAWLADNDPGAAKILAHRFPGVPNHGDITAVDWSAVEPVDVLCAGWPCQDISYAGRGEGIQEGNRSGLWYSVADAIGVLRPGLVALENVAGIVGRRPGLDVVLADLARLGLDVRWGCIRAAAVGAPHGRNRWFAVAYPHGAAWGERWLSAPGQAESGRSWADAGGRGGASAADADRSDGARGLESSAQRGPGSRACAPVDRPGGNCAPADSPRNGRHQGRAEPEGFIGGPDAALGSGESPADTDRTPGGRHQSWPGPGPLQGAAVAKRAPEQPGRLHSGSGDASSVATADTNSDGLPRGTERDSAPLSGPGGHEQRRVDPQRRVLDWGIYEPAIRRWERILGRPAPRPTVPVRTGDRLNPAFVEWMQGLPAGWVTDVPGLSRNAQLKALGNGVVPQQATAALRLLLAAATPAAEPGEATPGAAA